MRTVYVSVVRKIKWERTLYSKIFVTHYLEYCNTAVRVSVLFWTGARSPRLSIKQTWTLQNCSTNKELERAIRRLLRSQKQKKLCLMTVTWTTGSDKRSIQKNSKAHLFSKILEDICLYSHRPSGIFLAFILTGTCTQEYFIVFLLKGVVNIAIESTRCGRAF